MMESAYDGKFYERNKGFAVPAAGTVVPLVKQLIDVTSVADFGSSLGSWLRTWQQHGVEDVIGVDGPFVDPRQLVIPPERFITRDLSQPVDLGRRFDLAQSLEVAEHIPRASAEIFVGNLTRHADVVMFSAAPPGQGGVNHVNEQPYSYWRRIFARHGYQMFDCVRPGIAGQASVQPWYRYNTFLYVRSEAVASLSPAVRRTMLPDTAPIPDISPLKYKVRKAIRSWRSQGRMFAGDLA